MSSSSKSEINFISCMNQTQYIFKLYNKILIRYSMTFKVQMEFQINNKFELNIFLKIEKSRFKFKLNYD